MTGGQKVLGATYKLTRQIERIGGHSNDKRAMLVGMVYFIVLYGAAIWAIGDSKNSMPFRKNTTHGLTDDHIRIHGAFHNSFADHYWNTTSSGLFAILTKVLSR